MSPDGCRAWVAVGCASLLVLGACASPPARTDQESPTRIADITLLPDTTLIRGVVPSRTTLDGMLRTHGVAADAVDRVVSAARGVFDPRRLRSSQPFSLERTVEGALRLFEYEIDPDSILRITGATRHDSEPRAEVVPIPKTLEHDSAAGTIDADSPSLFEAMEHAGEAPELALALADVFGGEIDFNTELQPNDRFAVAFERWTREGRPSTYGQITVAEFHNDGRVVRAIRFTPPGGKPGYYDEQGRSVRRFFLRSPLKFEPRVTSRFSGARRHPVLQMTRAHRGVDYGAPTGAPVVAVASGTVVAATFDSTNGRMVRLRHSGGYESFYLHLSSFAAGMRRGVRVDQGQIIGRVGSTGLATGPHLHYGLQRQGAWVDPLREHRNMPPGEPIPAEAMAAFAVERDRAFAQLAQHR
jgi:murein DD-endopeptidase MepM/ murein hydrolase activator NlpD